MRRYDVSTRRSEAAGVSLCPPRDAHVVSLFDTDDSLTRDVAEHMASQLRTGSGGFIIAERHRWDDLRAALASRGVVVAAAEHDGRLRLADAEELLACICVAGRPDPVAFGEVVSALIIDMNRRYGHVTAFGEMVAILYAAGDVVATLELEAMWNELQRNADFDLLCGYPASLVEGAQREGLAGICDAHTAVLPTPFDVRPEQHPRSTHQVVIDPVAHEQDVREFTAMVVHDIRSPNAIIEGVLRLLLERRDDLAPGEVELLLERALAQSHRVDRLVQDILTMSRLDSGEFTYDATAVDLAAVVARTVEEQRVTRGWGITLEVVDELPLVWADEGRQVQVLENLLSNAAKFGSAQHIRVELLALPSAIEVKVIDDGRGMTDEELAQLFQPFSRLTRDRVGPEGGTGLGLYISRTLVEGQGGEIHVESVPGAGSTFVYTVPRIDAS